jgi:hypothetical protein
MVNHNFARQRTTLVKAFLISILNPNGARIDELVEHPERS